MAHGDEVMVQPITWLTEGFVIVLNARHPALEAVLKLSVELKSEIPDGLPLWAEEPIFRPETSVVISMLRELVPVKVILGFVEFPEAVNTSNGFVWLTLLNPITSKVRSTVSDAVTVTVEVLPSVGLSK